MTNKLITASFCAPCKVLKAEIEKRNINVEILDAENNQELVAEHGIRSVPTLILDNGEGYEIITGNDQILEALSGV